MILSGKMVKVTLIIVVASRGPPPTCSCKWGGEPVYIIACRPKNKIGMIIEEAAWVLYLFQLVLQPTATKTDFVELLQNFTWADVLGKVVESVGV